MNKYEVTFTDKHFNEDTVTVYSKSEWAVITDFEATHGDDYTEILNIELMDKKDLNE